MPGDDEERGLDADGPVEEVTLPDRWASLPAIDGNTGVQQLAPRSRWSLDHGPTGRWRVVSEQEGRQLDVRPWGSTHSGASSVELPVAEHRRLPAADWSAARVLPRAQASEPEAAREALTGAFRLLTARGESDQGLRAPQAGAVHAVLAHWSTGSLQPATVVLPTGTGKTDTMIALAAGERLERLLVLVPTDRLRTQLAEKFATYGVLCEQGVLDRVWPGPVVGRVAHGFISADNARRFARGCNVIVATPAALTASRGDALIALAGACSHLFIDEAHHVPAATWQRVRDAFAGKPVVQFTATPYRQDGKRLGGRVIYSYPLGQAQAAGFFQSIRYRSVISFADPDRHVAEVAIAQLRDDLAEGLDHLIMARVARIPRAEEVHAIYEELAPDLHPVVLHSELKGLERGEALRAIRERRSRIIVCVDMLGEGFDFPEMKIAALHDPHRSLGVALQFIGRFARSRPDLGQATAVVARPSPGYDERLRALYAERNEWDQVIEELASGAVEDVDRLDQFEEGFGAHGPDELPIGLLRPKMSAVAYDTPAVTWLPERLASGFSPEEVISGPHVNEAERVAWIVVRQQTPLRWAQIDGMENLEHHLYLLHWDQARRLLYVNCSDLESQFDHLAQAVCGEATERIIGEAVYRVLGDLQRATPTNVGLLDLRNFRRRFAMFVGNDVLQGLPLAEQQSRTNTNLSLIAYDKGERITISAARKRGRIWSHQTAESLWHWTEWARALGPKLQDASMDLLAVFRSFVRPKPLTERPELHPLSIDWSIEALLGDFDGHRLSVGGRTGLLIDADLRILEHDTSGPIPFRVALDGAHADYEAVIGGGRVQHVARGPEAMVLRPRAPEITLSDFLDKVGSELHFEDEVVVDGSAVYEIERELPPLERDRAVVLDWDGVDISRESQGPERDPATVQARAAQHLLELADWDVVLDDDGTGEIADLVAMRMEGDRLLVHLVHCKYSGAATPGARLGDLYEVCGQAQRSAHHRQHTAAMVANLIRRERHRQSEHDGQPGHSGLLVGDTAALLELEDTVRRRQPAFEISIAQPGISLADLEQRHLQVLSATEVYVSEVAYGKFELWCSP